MASYYIDEEGNKTLRERTAPPSTTQAEESKKPAAVKKPKSKDQKED